MQGKVEFQDEPKPGDRWQAEVKNEANQIARNYGIAKAQVHRQEFIILVWREPDILV